MMTVKAVVVFLCVVASSLIQPGEAQSAGLEFSGKLASNAEYEPWNWRPNTTLQFFFKTSSKKTAMVFYQDDGGKNQFMDLFLINGRARFRAKVGQGMTNIETRFIQHDFADSKWHKVKTEFSDEEIKFSIDVSEDKIFNVEPIAFTKFAAESPDNGGLFVAGIPLKSPLEWSYPLIFVQVLLNTAVFEGCIGDIRFNRVPNGRLERARLRHSVLATDTCEGACASRPQRCANGGRCIDRIRDSECDCTGIGYEGDSCTQRSTVVFMNGASYISYSLENDNPLRSTDRNALDFMFLTETKDGVFFYMGRDKDHLLVELVNGSLRVQADFGRGPVIVQSGGNLLSDSCWHHVEIRRRKRRLTVTIDRGETGKYHANSSQYFTLNLNNQSNVIYFGGGPSRVLPFAKAKALFFKGYLQKFRLEGISVLEKALGNRDGFSQIGVLEVYENNVQLQQAANNCQIEESGCSPSEDDSDSCNLSTTPTIAEIPWALRFIEEPADTQFAHTRSAMLNCKVEDRPKATITWKIARTDHVISSNITGLRHILPNGSLYFPAFTEDNFRLSVHQADYQCVAKNNVGNQFEIISRIAKLRAVIIQPHKMYAQDAFVIGGSTAVIKSVIPRHVRDYVRVVSWHNAHKVIALGSKYYLMPSGDLVITNVDYNEAKATYYFTAVNTLTGEKHFSNPAKLFLKEQIPSPPRILNTALNITVREGEPTKLQCVVEGYPVPTQDQYTWMKDGVSIQMGHRFSRFAGGSLSIDTTQFGDQGLYECSVKTSKGAASIYIYLTVLVPLRFVSKPRRKVAALSSNAGYIMECEVTGQPKPNITWLLNGKQFTGDYRISIKPNRLEFAVIYSKDIGVYQCIADNGREMVQSSAVLITAERNPSITTSAQQVVLNPGQSLNEWCRAYSQSEPEITWYLDDVQVHDGNGYTITHTLLRFDAQSTLKADNMNVKKSGEYKCVACNIGNCTTEVIRVYIDGTTNITSIPRNVNATRGQSIQLPCVVKGYPVPTVTWSKDGASIPYDQRQSVSDDNTLHISKVQNGDAGRYKCTAVNSDNKRDEGYVVVTVFELPSPEIRQREWHEGCVGVLICSSATGGGSTGSLNFRWLKDGHDLVTIPGVINIHSVAGLSILELKSLTAGDSGKYTCVANNKAGTTSVSADMVVYVPPKFLPESANHQQPSTQQVLKTYTTYLTCLTSGTPPPRIDWFKSVGGRFDAVPLDKARIWKMVNGTLVISNVNDDDDGEYLCTANNAVSDRRIRRKVRLIVNAVPPKFQANKTL